MGKADHMEPPGSGSRTHHQRVCPWWCCFTFDNAFRRIFHDPERILGPYVKPGWTVLDVGPGMGYFTITLARLVGDTGKVIAADLQQKMLDGIARRALRAGVRQRVELLRSQPDRIGIDRQVDFCLVFWMAHEVPDLARFFAEIASSLKPDGLLLLAEPVLHVSRRSFDSTLGMAEDAGLTEAGGPDIFASHAALLKRPGC